MEKNKKGVRNLELVIRAFALLLPVIFSSCSISKQISKQANTILLKDTAISSGHIGISIYEPATNKYWYNYNATKYFIPASNTKLFTLYAGMKYLGDSLVGIYFNETLDEIKIIGNGDPTFLYPDYKTQPVFDFLRKKINKKISLFAIEPPFYYHKNFLPLGKGWSWDDYNSSYMAERSFFPLYGNVVKFILKDNKISISPPFFYSKTFQEDSTLNSFYVDRMKGSNAFFIYGDSNKNTNAEIPFKIGLDNADHSIEAGLLSDTLHQNIIFGKLFLSSLKDFQKVHSQPTDSLFKPMMHRSDNFFAEQTLLMASNEHLGFMNDEKIIDTILKLDLKDISQRPKWVDGSGLSRYNLFTPKSFVYILNKMKNEFGLERMKNILPTGCEGTLSSYYKKDAGFIYAKTGTLSNNCALSGYLITHKGKLLIFSVLSNNYITGATPVRKAVEQFLLQLREKY